MPYGCVWCGCTYLAIFFMALSISVTPTLSDADPSTDRNLDKNGDD